MWRGGIEASFSPLWCQAMTVHLSFLNRIRDLGAPILLIFAGFLWVSFAEHLSKSPRRGWPVPFEITFGCVLSIVGAYIFYRAVKKYWSKIPRIELNDREMSIFYGLNKAETYAWSEIEIFFMIKNRPILAFNKDCVALKLKEDSNNADVKILPAGLDQSASRLTDFLNSQRLKFGSEQNQKNG